MTRRMVEVFTAECPCCEETVKLVESLSCGSCDVQVLDLREDAAAQEKAESYGVTRVPAVAVDGRLAGCCQSRVDPDQLRRLGLGTGA